MLGRRARPGFWEPHRVEGYQHAVFASVSAGFSRQKLQGIFLWFRCGSIA